MDLSTLEMKSTDVVVALVHPATNIELVYGDPPVPMTITVAGKYSEDYKSMQAKQQNARLKRAERGNKVTVTAEEVAADRLELVIRCIRSWNILVDGATPPCNPETVREAFSRFPWIREQVEWAMEDSRSFLTE